MRRVLEGSPRTPTTELTRTGVDELLAEAVPVLQEAAQEVEAALALAH